MNRLATLLAQPIVNEIARDSAKPRTHFSRLAKLRKLSPGGQKCFLRQVLALRKTAGGAVSQRADERLIAGNDFGESVQVARTAPGHQIGVVHRGHRVHYHNASYVVAGEEKVTEKR